MTARPTRLMRAMCCALIGVSMTANVTASSSSSPDPLPETASFDDVPFPAAGTPPLPSTGEPVVRDADSRVVTRGASLSVTNPFQAGDDGSPPLSAADDSPIAPRQDSDDLADAAPRAVGKPLRETPPPNGLALTGNEAAGALEGPPVPLAALPRLGGTQTAATGTADDIPADRPITLNFQRAEMAAVLAAFAKFTGLNVIASEKVRGVVTMRLDKVPWRTAFDMLLDVNGLAMEKRGNVIWVAPVAELAARERQRFEAHARAADLEPLASRSFELHFAKAEDVRKLLTGSGAQRVLSKRGAAVADPRTNLLFVTDLGGRLEQIADLLKTLDRPTRQVLIEARIVEGEQGFSRNLGVRLKMASVNDDASGRGFSGNAEGSFFDLSARPINGFDAATACLTLFAAQATRLLNIELTALEAEGHGETVSSPRVVTADRMRAVVEQGQELPYQAKVAQGVSGVQFRRATLKLEVEPQITPDGRIVMDLDINKDSVGEQTDAGPAVNTKHVQTRVEVEDGGTVSIGGIYSRDGRDDVTRVPLLGKIPILGALFSNRAHRDRRSELVVFITPRVVRID